MTVKGALLGLVKLKAVKESEGLIGAGVTQSRQGVRSLVTVTAVTESEPSTRARARAARKTRMRGDARPAAGARAGTCSLTASTARASSPRTRGDVRRGRDARRGSGAAGGDGPCARPRHG